ncbi:MAG: YbaK/EbsC family protein [archaeon]
MQKNSIGFEEQHHEPVFTSEEAAKVRGTKLRQGAKALIFKADSDYILTVVSAENEVDELKLKTLVGAKHITLAKPDEVEKVTGLQIGSVPPIASVLGLKLYVDNSLSKNQVIAFNAGSHTDSIKMGYGDYKRLEKPVMGEFAKGK